jgi:hypothetical protein
MAEFEKVEFEFPDEKESKENARKGGAVVAPEPEVEIEAEDAKPEIEVVDDTPEKDRGREPMVTPPPADLSDDDLEKYDLSVRKRIKQVQKGYHEERRAKEAAHREKEEALRLAQQLVEENKKLKGSLSQGQNALLEQAKKVVANELDHAKRKYKEAYEAGDADALVAAQEELTTAKLKAERVNNFKPAPVQEEKNEVQTFQQTPQAPQVDPKLRAWQDDNPWFGPNKRMTAYALGLHEELTADGIAAGSDAYYKAIDTEMRSRFPDVFESGKTEKGEDAPTPPKKSNVVAPATRSTAPKKIVLTKTQVELAKRLGVPLELYARKVAEEMRK